MPSIVTHSPGASSIKVWLKILGRGWSVGQVLEEPVNGVRLSKGSNLLSN